MVVTAATDCSALEVADLRARRLATRTAVEERGTAGARRRTPGGPRYARARR
ncbi:hypothetical protein HC023_25615, partial [Streptomyces sp. NEAU-H3]|nr:hypothetical protein [Streptomyces sp. NEAU-H3]